MIWILDASAAIEIVLQREHANSIQNDIRMANYVISPQLFVLEVANVFWKYNQFEGLGK